MIVLIKETIQQSRRNKPDPKLHPIQHAIFDAYISRMEKALEDWIPSEDRREAQTRLWDEIMDLQGWVAEGPEKWMEWTEDHDDSAGDMLVRDFGKSYSEAKRLIRKSKELRRGRPGTSRRVAVKGLELKLLRPSLGWVDVRDEVCDCGQPRHGDSCLARLKTAVSALKGMLLRYNLKSD